MTFQVKHVAVVVGKIIDQIADIGEMIIQKTLKRARAN